MRSMKSGKFRSRKSATIFVFLIFIEAVHCQGFTFNNQLSVIANDCYTRVAIGSRLPDTNTTTVSVATVSDCEDACSNNRTICRAISFGIGVRGNATCMLGNEVPNASILQADEDYDVYVRTQKTPFCQADRLFSLGTGGNMQMPNSTTTVMPGINFMNNPLPMQPSVVFQSTRPNGARVTGNTINQRWFPTNDDDFRSYDIERNKNQQDSHEKVPPQHSNYHFNQFDKIDNKEPGFFDKFDYGSLFAHKNEESTKTVSDDFGNFYIGKNLYPTDLTATSKPVIQQTYLSISGKTKTAGNRDFDFEKSLYAELPFVTKTGDNALTKSYGFVIDHELDKIGFSGGSSGQKPISIFEFSGLDKSKSWEEGSNDGGTGFRASSPNNRGVHRYSPSTHRADENVGFRHAAQGPSTSGFKFSPERNYLHYKSGGNDRGRGSSNPKKSFQS